jgi:hypothetical protein
VCVFHVLVQGVVVRSHPAPRGRPAKAGAWGSPAGMRRRVRS